MPNFIVVKAFRDKEADLKLFESGSNYVSDDKKRIDYLVKEGFLKSEEEPTTVKKESIENEKVTTKPEGKKKATRKKSGE